MTMASELDLARARIGALESLCADMYQLAGVIGAPVRFLDALWAAAQGERLPRRELLPVTLLDCDEIRSREVQLAEVRKVLGVSAAAELGRVGGSKTSRAKQRAAREWHEGWPPAEVGVQGGVGRGVTTLAS
jgi:hypothetical protein